jgi:5-formyltetrahydrofolate cyclo-ligase
VIGGDPARSGAKIAMRDQVLTARNRMSLAERAEAALALSQQVVNTREAGRAATVAAYVSVGSEPGTALLLNVLWNMGTRVVLPVLLPDGDLDWARYDEHEPLVPAPRGLLQPGGPLLGVEAVATADLVLVPGLAVSDRGDRLGRGGGSYDRVLGRVPVGTPVWTLLYDDEVGLDVPVEPHDRPVTAAVTPSGIHRFRTAG